MLFGCLVIGNLQLIICNRQLPINNWSLVEGNAKKTIGNWTDQTDCTVSGQSRDSRQTRMSGLWTGQNILTKWSVLTD